MYYGTLKVRECINQMRKVRSHTIYLNNGTKIILREMFTDKEFCIGTFKWNEDGSWRVMRRIFCSVYPSEKTIGMDELKEKYWMFDPKDDGLQYFNDDDFLIPERMMNQFISQNGGIEEYRTISCPYYMMVDTMALCAEIDKDW